MGILGIADEGVGRAKKKSALDHSEVVANALWRLLGVRLATAGCDDSRKNSTWRIGHVANAIDATTEANTLKPMNPNSLLNLSVSQLKKAAQLKEQIDALNDELLQLLGGEIPVPFVTAPRRGRPPGKRGGMSAAGRARIAAAARARWAKIKAAGGAANLGGSAAPKKKRTMSAAARAKIAAAQRARWARRKG